MHHSYTSIDWIYVNLGVNYTEISSRWKKTLTHVMVCSQNRRQAIPWANHIHSIDPYNVTGYQRVKQHRSLPVPLFKAQLYPENDIFCILEVTLCNIDYDLRYNYVKCNHANVYGTFLGLAYMRLIQYAACQFRYSYCCPRIPAHSCLFYHD